MAGETPQPPPLAGIGVRAAARVADVALVMFPVWLLLVPLMLTVVGDDRVAVVLMIAVAWAVVIGYETWLTSLTGQTLGKRAVGIRVVATGTTRPPAFGPSLARAALPPLAGMVLPGFGWLVPYMWAVWTPDRRGLHDLFASTTVIMIDQSGVGVARV